MVAGIVALGGVVALAVGSALVVAVVVADGVLVVTLKLGPYDIIHPYNNYGVKHALFFGGFVAFSELWTLFLRSR